MMYNYRQKGYRSSVLSKYCAKCKFCDLYICGMKSAKTVHKFIAYVHFVGLRPPLRRSVVDRYCRKVVFDTWYQAWEFLNDFCPGDYDHTTEDIDYFVETVSLTLSLDPVLWFLTEGK